ncbi:ribbon-helix-helix protein, CopG family [Pseudomonas sp. WC2]|uniref:ribbon-helix-helix protein, CopG family n=1 Tax=Pseudomonas sp. WC2 TaxID=3424773 RepID=UPI003D336A08
MDPPKVEKIANAPKIHQNGTKSDAVFCRQEGRKTMSRMSVNLSPEMERLVDETAESEGITKSEVIRRAFALLKVAESEKKKGRFLAVAKENQAHDIEVIGRILGL